MTREEFLSHFENGVLKGPLTLGEGCRLSGLLSNVDLGTPSLTPSELEIVRQIDVSRCDMRKWHCGTAHCLAGWCQYLSGREGDPEKIGREMLPSLSHLFYCTEASEPVRQMLLRLQALPV